MANSKLIEYVDDITFSGSVQNGVVLVDFFAEWCAPCRMISPILEEVAADVAGTAKVVKVDVDNAQTVAAQFGVTSIPTLLLMKDGKEVKRIVGVRDKETLVSMIQSV